VGKVMHPLVERSDSKTRRRANSSAASSAGDSVSMCNNGPPTPMHSSSESTEDKLYLLILSLPSDSHLHTLFQFCNLKT
jgi:hypothetical protein